ncbi:MAG: ABC transporter permease [Calditrichaeota bacterium]|nr:MAG: ABC transporter permease [Calditrichota bacterium]MBL1206781.1 ABC transporter permease [Calditrichota bacterium]NOG46609.1 ABC transporter permease [Calditrichota bacterium]
MNKIIAIVKREFKESVLKKSFIIMTLLTPIIMVGFTVVPTMLATMEVEEPTVLSIYDETDFIANNLSQSLVDTLTGGTPRFILNILNKNNDRLETIEQQKQLISDGSIDGFLLIPENVINDGEMIYYSKNVANFDLNRRIRKSVSTTTVDYRLLNSGLDNELINELTKRVEMKTIKITKEGTESERGFETEFFSTFIFVFILYITLIMYGFVLMRSIIEEKTTRIIEVLLSSANPFQIMAGKMIGQGSVGLTQYLIWALFGTALIFLGPSMMPVSADMFSFSPSILFYFVLFYLLGYFLYAALYTGVGAITNTDQEAQQMATPITLMLVVPLILLTFMVKNPDNSVIEIMSYVPFFSPMIMFARINLAEPSLLEIWSSVGILVLSIILMIWLSAKIFRIGILMYGKRPTLPEIIRWIK